MKLVDEIIEILISEDGKLSEALIKTKVLLMHGKRLMQRVGNYINLDIVTWSKLTLSDILKISK